MPPRTIIPPSTDLDRASAPAEFTKEVDLNAGSDFKLGATIYIGTGGTIVIDGMRDADGTMTAFKNVPDGSILPVRVKRVYSADDGTTCLDIVAIW